jgi:hypothetical protein
VTPGTEGEDKKQETQWNLEAIAEVLNAECRSLNWTLVAKNFDSPNLVIRSEAEYQLLVRIFLVLLHDFPEFLADFHLSFCDLIPMNCVQLRNLILSAFPKVGYIHTKHIYIQY